MVSKVRQINQAMQFFSYSIQIIEPKITTRFYN